MRNSRRHIRRGPAAPGRTLLCITALSAAIVGLPALTFAQTPQVSEAERARTEAEQRAQAIERNARENARCAPRR